MKLFDVIDKWLRATKVRAYLLATVFVISNTAASARVWRIPDDVSTIHAALDSIIAGDEIVLAPGIYHESAFSTSVGFQLRSATGQPEDVILDAGGTGSFFSASWLTSDVVIDGITFQNAHNLVYSDNYAGGWVSFLNCRVTELTGTIANSYQGAIRFYDTVFYNNISQSPGTALFISSWQASVWFVRCTILNNSAGESMLLRTHESAMSFSNTIIAFNDCAGIYELEDWYLAVHFNCTDIYGNSGGDWEGDIANQAEIYGNMSVDPLFCDGPNDYFGISSDSPCVGTDMDGCGVIGAGPVGCFLLDGTDVENDEGGFVELTWLAHRLDQGNYEIGITEYFVELGASTWETISIVAATGLPSYSAIVPAACQEQDGQDVCSRFRVKAITRDPTQCYGSNIISVCSVDNLPPAPPVLAVYDTETSRVLAWENPTGSDFSQSCLYRGAEPAFIPGEPILCSDTLNWYLEDHLARYYYRARSFDIHGNASEWSNEVVGQYPTGVPGAMPTALRLYPNQPNPFNPSTTIKYDVPVDGRTTLRVYDIRGAQVRTLVDTDLPRGSHQATWDGRDASGRAMPSGTYFARLEAGGRVETVRMSLVR